MREYYVFHSDGNFIKKKGITLVNKIKQKRKKETRTDMCCAAACSKKRLAAGPHLLSTTWPGESAAAPR